MRRACRAARASGQAAPTPAGEQRWPAWPAPSARAPKSERPEQSISSDCTRGESQAGWRNHITQLSSSLASHQSYRFALGADPTHRRSRTARSGPAATGGPYTWRPPPAHWPLFVKDLSEICSSTSPVGASSAKLRCRPQLRCNCRCQSMVTASGEVTQFRCCQTRISAVSTRFHRGGGPTSSKEGAPAGAPWLCSP